MRKLNKSHPFIALAVKERWIVSDTFFRMFQAALPQLDIKEAEGEWDRGFFVPASKDYLVGVKAVAEKGRIKGVFYYSVGEYPIRSEKFDWSGGKIDLGLEFALQLCWFMDVTEPWEEIIDPKQTTRKAGKLQNKTNLPIKLLTVGYFKTSVRTEGFKVRGHWRWQAYGKGMKKRKLKWIMPFEKKGYTRKSNKNGTTEQHTR